MARPISFFTTAKDMPVDKKIEALVSRLIIVKPDEFKSLAWSFLYFFALLAGYFIIRPVREAMGIMGGVQNLPWLFSGTFIAMLLLSPIFAWAVSRFPKRVFLPGVYIFFILNLVGFWGLLSFGETRVWGARAFFIWTSTFNLFVVSVFWSFMVDIFTKAQAKRLFGFIAAGGTLGTIAGAGLTATLAEITGEQNLLLVSALFLAFAMFCIHQLLPHAGRARPNKVIGGHFYAGFRDIIKNPYLLNICLFFVLFTLTATFLYFQQAEIISKVFETSAERTRIFAIMDLSVSILTVLTQTLVTPRFVKRFGIRPTVMFLPVVTMLGFVLFAFFPTLAMLVLFQVIRRASDYAITRPGREMLFSIVSEEQKYKAKNVIDTVVYRGGDAASGWIYAAIASGLGLGVPAIAAIAAPIAGVWAGLGWLLGRTYDRNKDEGEPDHEKT